jgi:hypothetical protein
MTFMQRLMSDAQPKADKMSNVTRGFTVKVCDSTVAKAAKRAAYKGLVSTVAVGLVITQSPAGDAVKSACSKMWDGVENLAAEGEKWQEAQRVLATAPCPSCGAQRINGVCKVHGTR